MLILTYNSSPKLTESLRSIEQLRARLAVYPIPPKADIRFKWESLVLRTYWTLSFSDNSLSKTNISKLASALTTNKRLSPIEKEAINYIDAQRYIAQNWYVTPKPVTPGTIKTLYDIACRPTLGAPGTSFTKNRDNLQTFTEYLRQGSDHPVIQAGVAQVQLMNLVPFEKDNGKISRLIPYLYLYRFGYDFRKMLVLEDYWQKDQVALRQAIQNAILTKNLTVWLEYFANAIHEQLKTTLENVTDSKILTDTKASHFKLNKRQNEILKILEEPGVQITNKEIQKKFDISQITASRDLAKLFNLDLLLVHGRGRSTYYTKV